MESNLSRLLVGLSVQISRSDGRVHSATVKSVDGIKGSAMVDCREHLWKEVDIKELCLLNPELLEPIHSATSKAANPPDPEKDKKYEGQFCSSRIPVPPSSSAPVVPTAQESEDLQKTCLFPVPAPVAAPASTAGSSQANPEAIRADLKPLPVLTNFTIPNQQRKEKDAKLASSLPVALEAIKANEPESMPPLPSAKGRRKAVAPQELNKGNKRLISVVKPFDTQSKKAKGTDVDTSGYDTRSQVAEFEENVYAELKRGNELVNDMKQTSYNIEAGFLNLMDHSRKLMDTVLALQSAMDQERITRLHH